MEKQQYLTKNQQIVLNLVEKSTQPLKAYSILFNVQKKGIKAPLQVYRALDRLGVDTEMIVYPRTPHGPREPKFLMDVSERILVWFEKYK